VQVVIYLRITPIAPLWNWNFTSSFAKGDDVPLQSHLYGIEISNETAHYLPEIHSNRTFMELKLTSVMPPSEKLYHSNRTFMELKLATSSESLSKDSILQSHLYGIEIWHCLRLCTKLGNSNRTFMELKYGLRKHCVWLANYSNRTFMELKWKW